MPSRGGNKHTKAKHVDSERKETRHNDDNKENGERQFVQIDKKSVEDCTTHWDDPEQMAANQREFKKFQEEHRKNKTKQSQAPHGLSDEVGKKRGRGANAVMEGQDSKKQKTNGEPHGTAGDKTRVPKKGQKVQWHALPGYVNGQVVEVVYEEKEVDGENVKASKEDPRIVLRSEKSGKICVHKPEAVYFD